MLRESDLYLPAKGWGRIVLAASASASRAGTAWTAANQRITDALGTKDTEPEPGDEEDGDSEKAS
jgi:hypothetical protein